MAEAEDLVLRLERVLPAPRERVFKALIEPEDLEYWWGPNGFKIPEIEIDLRVGGTYRFAMQPPEGELFYLTGEYREVDPPTRLSYTFIWEDPDPDDRETLVTLALTESGDETDLGLVQESFATQGRYDLHKGGWTDSFDRLEQMLSA